MQIQHQLGADIIFAFDELTTLMNTRAYQESSRTYPAVGDSLPRRTQSAQRAAQSPSAAITVGVIQGAQYEDLRRKASRDLVALGDADRAAGGKLRRLRNRRRPRKGQPGHDRRLGQFRTAAGCAETPARNQRTRRHLHRHRERCRHLRLRVAHSRRPQRRDLFARRPLQRHQREIPQRTSDRSTRTPRTTPRSTVAPTLHHLFKAKEGLAATLATLHNVRSS